MKFITVAGSPSSGKTAVLIHTIRHLLEDGRKVTVGKIDCLETDDGDRYRKLGIPVIIGLSDDAAVLPLPFTRASRNKNVRMIWPKEGAVCLPQVLIHKKGSLKQTLKISEYLLSENVQRFISETGMMVPVDPDVSLPPEVEKNNLNIYWKGWDWFIGGINS